MPGRRMRRPGISDSDTLTVLRRSRRRWCRVQGYNCAVLAAGGLFRGFGRRLHGHVGQVQVIEPGGDPSRTAARTRSVSASAFGRTRTDRLVGAVWTIWNSSTPGVRSTTVPSARGGTVTTGSGAGSTRTTLNRQKCAPTKTRSPKLSGALRSGAHQIGPRRGAVPQTQTGGESIGVVSGQ